jgi:hypothetical protein
MINTTRSLLRLAYLLFAVLPFLTNTAFSQSQYSDSLLAQKRSFNSQGASALAEPFRGVATSAGIQQGLFPVRTTGVSTDSIRAAAETFLATLSAAELSRTHYAVDDPEWRNWSNVDVGIFARHGISLEEMSQQQKDAAFGLLRASLSAEGLETAEGIMRTEQTLLELNGEAIRYGEEKYYFTMMGIPSSDEPWGWQLDGHHLVINDFVLGDQFVMAPTFLGGEPTVTTTGVYAGSSILQTEQNQGLAFMQSLDDQQRSKATVNPDKTRNDMIAAANQDNLTLDYEGLPGSELTGAQKQQFLQLIRVYVGNMRDDQAQVHMEEVAQHLDETYFSWVGNSEPDAVFYYRIHSPVVLIEFDHENPVGTPMLNQRGVPNRQHIHIVVRTPNGNDYGKDLLRQHLIAHPH